MMALPIHFIARKLPINQKVSFSILSLRTSLYCALFNPHPEQNPEKRRDNPDQLEFCSKPRGEGLWNFKKFPTCSYAVFSAKELTIFLNGGFTHVQNCQKANKARNVL